MKKNKIRLSETAFSENEKEMLVALIQIITQKIVEEVVDERRSK